MKKQKKKNRISLMEKIRRLAINMYDRMDQKKMSRDHRRWAEGWKRNARYKGKPLTRSMIRRVGSRERAIELGLFKPKVKRGA